MKNPAQSLLLDHLNTKPNARILLLEGGDGWLAAEVARKVPAGEVLSLTRDIREVWSARTQLDSLSNATVSLDVFPKTSDWDSVLLTIPKGRRFTRTMLLVAWEAIKPGGKLILAGPSKAGAKAVIQDAKRLFGNVAVLGYRNHQRVAASIRGQSLPDPLPKEFQQPGIAPNTKHFVDVDRPEGTLKLETHPGIFSWEALDEGTALLLGHLKIEMGACIWDVGCGYGAIGLSAALAGAEFVAMSDVNLLAVKSSLNNALVNGLTEHVNVFPSDGLQYSSQTILQTTRFDLIVSNPAFHQGRNIDKSMPDAIISRAPQFLKSDGRLLIVANRFLNYDHRMKESFSRVEKLAETNKYHIIEAKK